jgi:molecular chaperone GrpE (heat shock protein)
MRWLKRWFSSRPVDEDREARLALEARVQSLSLDLGEREASVANLREELARTRAAAASQAEAQAFDRIARLFEGLAAPAAQLHLQGHLLEVQRRPVQARDVMANARRLLVKLEDAGLRFDGELGAEAAFDPNLHQPLSGEALPAHGERVIVRIAGVAWQGRVLRRAGVEPATSAKIGGGP